MGREKPYDSGHKAAHSSFTIALLGLTDAIAGLPLRGRLRAVLPDSSRTCHSKVLPVRVDGNGAGKGGSPGFLLVVLPLDGLSALPWNLQEGGGKSAERAKKPLQR